MKYLSIIISVFLAIMFPANIFAVSENVTKIVFTTDSQAIEKGVISGPITIQTQNEGGSAEQISETSDLTFVSSSPSGEFLSSSGSPVSTTMNKNTANRTFYYRDSVSGVYTITVTLTGRVSLKKWTASQNITVGNPDQVSSSGQNETVSEETDTNDSEGSSSHSSQSELTDNSSISSRIEVSAGRNRLSSVGSPVSFSAEIIKPSNLSDGLFEWSFGDGGSSVGRNVSHTYAYPGEYSVVLNASLGANSAVSKTAVRVVSPKVAMFCFGDRLEIKNNSSYELNLNRWRIVSGTRIFVFPADTIVGANNIGIFPGAVTGIVLNDRNDIELMNPSFQKISSCVKNMPVDMLYAEALNAVGSVPTFEKNGTENVISYAEPVPVYSAVIADEQNTEADQAEIPNDSDIVINENEESAVFTVKRESLFTKIVHLPGNGLRFLKNLIF